MSMEQDKELESVFANPEHVKELIESLYNTKEYDIMNMKVHNVWCSRMTITAKILYAKRYKKQYQQISKWKIEDVFNIATRQNMKLEYSILQGLTSIEAPETHDIYLIMIKNEVEEIIEKVKKNYE